MAQLHTPSTHECPSPFTHCCADLPDNGALNDACTSAGVAKHGTPLGLFDKVKVDMIVVGSSAVSPSGARLGKGEVCVARVWAADAAGGEQVRLMCVTDDSNAVVATCCLPSRHCTPPL